MCPNCHAGAHPTASSFEAPRPVARALAGLSLRAARLRTLAALHRHKYDVNASLTCLRFLTSGFAYAKRTLPSLKRGSRSDGSRSHHLVWRRDQSDRGSVPELLVLLFPTRGSLDATVRGALPRCCHHPRPFGRMGRKRIKRPSATEGADGLSGLKI